MEWPWTRPLTDDQTADPILYHEYLDADALPWISTFELEMLFPTRKHSLKTWGRAGEDSVHDFRKKNADTALDPHWIGVRKQTGLHTDPSYPRYSHQLVLRADGYDLLGMSSTHIPVTRGMYYVLDGHSPHQLAATDRKTSDFYVAASVDSKTPLDRDEALAALLDYVQTAPFLPADLGGTTPAPT